MNWKITQQELRGIIEESLIESGLANKKKVNESYDPAAGEPVNFHFDIIDKTLSTSPDMPPIIAAATAKIASVGAITLTNEEILISNIHIPYNTLQICGKIWDIKKGEYDSQRLFVLCNNNNLIYKKYSREVVDLLLGLLKRIVMKREENIQAYYKGVLERTDDVSVKKTCVDLLREAGFDATLIGRYNAGFELYKGILLWHDMEVNDNVIERFVEKTSHGDKRAEKVHLKKRLKDAPDKYREITRCLKSAETGNYLLAYDLHFELLEFYSRDKIAKELKEGLVEVDLYEKLAKEVYEKIKSGIELNSFDIIRGGIEERKPKYALYAKLWYYFAYRKKEISTAKEWADLLINTDCTKVKYGEIYYWYSTLYRDGVGGVERDAQEQRKFLLRAYDHGSGNAAMALSNIYKKEGEIEQAAIFKNAAKKRGVSKSEDEARLPTLDEIVAVTEKLGQGIENLTGPVSELFKNVRSDVGSTLVGATDWLFEKAGQLRDGKVEKVEAEQRINQMRRKEELDELKQAQEVAGQKKANERAQKRGYRPTRK